MLFFPFLPSRLYGDIWRPKFRITCFYHNDDFCQATAYRSFCLWKSLFLIIQLFLLFVSLQSFPGQHTQLDSPRWFVWVQNFVYFESPSCKLNPEGGSPRQRQTVSTIHHRRKKRAELDSSSKSMASVRIKYNGIFLSLPAIFMTVFPPSFSDSSRCQDAFISSQAQRRLFLRQWHRRRCRSADSHTAPTLRFDRQVTTCSAKTMTDGLIQQSILSRYYREEADIELPPMGQYATGICFVDELHHDESEAMFQEIARECSLQVSRIFCTIE